MDEKIQYLLKELELCQAEIYRRSQEQFRAVISALLAIGTIIGLVSEFTDSLINLLAAVPWIHAVLGYVWVDHSFAIFRIGDYLRSVHEPKIRETIDDADVGIFKYVGDMRLRAHHRNEKTSQISYYFPLIFFVLPSVLALVAFVVFHMMEGKPPDIFAMFLLGASMLFTAVLFRHWRYSVRYIERHTTVPKGS